MAINFTFGTFIEHVSAKTDELREADNGGWAAIPPLSQSHIFWLGDDKKFYDHVLQILPDLCEDMKDKLHMPFSDISMVSQFEDKVNGPTWCVDRVIEDMLMMPRLIHPTMREAMMQKVRSAWKQPLTVLRYQVSEKPCAKNWASWMLSFEGCKEEKIYCYVSPSEGLKKEMKEGYITEAMLHNETRVILQEIAAITHPENYIVQVTPELTSKEQRKVDAGRPRPPQKSRHFIVLDHEVLVSMRRDPQETHASPVPHERRGHWRRLADRCRQAKLLGKERVFVRPTIVGDLEWKGPKALYEVMPQLNDRHVAGA